MEIGIREAKVNLSKLIKAALDGEQIVITNRGKPLVQLVRAPTRVDRKRVFGSMPWLEIPEETPEQSEAFANLFEAVREAKGES